MLEYFISEMHNHAKIWKLWHFCQPRPWHSDWRAESGPTSSIMLRCQKIFHYDLKYDIWSKHNQILTGRREDCKIHSVIFCLAVWCWTTVITAGSVWLSSDPVPTTIRLRPMICWGSDHLNITDNRQIITIKVSFPSLSVNRVHKPNQFG